MRQAGRLVLLWLGLIALFSALMIGAYSLPDSVVRPHVEPSLRQLEAEGHPYVPFFGLSALIPDNFTDALLLNLAMNTTDATPPVAAFGNYMRVTADPSGEPMPIESLRAAVEGRGEVVAYSRYWHGYQSVLRPLLMLFDYRSIRLLNVGVLLAAIVAATGVMWVRVGLKSVLAFTISLAWAGVFIVPVSMQYMGVTVLAVLGVAVVLRRTDAGGQLRDGVGVFLILGSTTAFIDLLTKPLLTLGLPLAVLLALRIQARADAGPLGNELLLAVRLAAAWISGFAGTWIAKWLIASLVLRERAWLQAFESAAYWLEGDGLGQSTGPLDALLRNVGMKLPLVGLGQAGGIHWPTTVAALIAAGLVAVVIGVLLLRHRRTDGRLRSLTPLLVLALVPYVWYVVMADHSTVHYWFTYRIQAITVYAAIFSLLFAFDPEYLYAVRTRARRWLQGDASRQEA